MPPKKINLSPTFQKLINPLSQIEFEQLELDIKEHGCLSPLIVWKQKSILLDGHNRYKICTENNIKYKVEYISFKDSESATMWVITNQLGRRNLSVIQRCLLVLRNENVIKTKAKLNQLSGLKQFQSKKGRTKEEVEGINTDYSLALLAGTSHNTIHQVRKIFTYADKEIKSKLINGDISINGAYNKIKNIDKSAVEKIDRFIEIEQADVLYTHYWTLVTEKRKPDGTPHFDSLGRVVMRLKHTLSHISRMLKEDSTIILWAGVSEFLGVYDLMNKLGYKQHNNALTVWQNKDSLQFFILFSKGKGAEMIEFEPSKHHLMPKVVIEEWDERSLFDLNFKPKVFKEFVEIAYEKHKIINEIPYESYMLKKLNIIQN